ncbi:MAG: sulfotransferase [Alphaproteobacteria bacterium]|nr:sulfotransferase [Alphaproteobacteria bacterium]
MFTGPLFVVGAPRSGTKLLRDLIRQHPRIGIPTYETEFLPRLSLTWSQFGDLSDRVAFERFYAWATRYLYFKYNTRDGTLISADAWYAGCRSFDIQGVFEALCRHDGEVPDDGIWGDKSPNYRNHVPELAALWPDARFVHIIRDIRDVALSSRKAWGKSVLRNAQRWVDEVSACRAAGRSLSPPARYHELRYEDLLQDPEAAMRQIAAFVGVDFVPEMTRPGRVSENLGDTRGQDRIVPGNTEKWRERMPADQLRHVEAICGPLLAELGYPLAHPLQPLARLGPARMVIHRAADGYNLLRFRVREWGWREAVRYSLSAWESTRA